jgi:hypothetical protein
MLLHNGRCAQREHYGYCLSVPIPVPGGRPDLVISPPRWGDQQTLTMAKARRCARIAFRWRRYRRTDGPGATLAPIVVLICSVHAASGSAAQGPCAMIRQLCENAGFVQGAAQSGNGLQRDCIQPIMQAATQSRGASRPLPLVDPLVVTACRAAEPEFGKSTAIPKGAPSGQGPSTLQDASADGNSGQSTTKRPTLTYVPGSTHKSVS